jgi:putative salt-induced outer membrane protein YdiY
MRCARFVLLLLALTVANLARADVVQLKNGDRLNGSLKRLINGTITFATPNLGTLNIPVASIVSLNSQAPVVVILKKGKPERGSLTLQSGVWRVESSAGTITLAPGDLVAIYLPQVYEKQGPNRPHRPWQDWHGEGAAGYILQESSQNSKSLSVNFTSSRVEPTLPGMMPRRATHFSYNMAFATVTQSGVTTTANTLTSVLRQDFFFGGDASNYFFVQGEWDHIQPQELNIRQTYGGGLGRNLVHHPKLTFAVQGGFTYVRSNFETGELTNEMEALAGEKVVLTVFKRLSINHEFDFYPSLTSAGDYRFNSLTALNAPISKRFSFNISVNDQYLSTPVPGTEANVLILSTGLGVNF